MIKEQDMAKAVSKDKEGSLEEWDNSFIQVSNFTENLPNLDADDVKEYVLKLNSKLAAQVASAEEALKHVDKTHAKSAKKAVHLLKDVFDTCKKIASSIKKGKPVDEEALKEEFDAQINEAISFVSSLEGVDPAFIQKTKHECERMSPGELLARLKQISKEVPAQFKRTFELLVSETEKLVSPEKENFALYVGLPARIVGLGILYFIVWTILGLLLTFIYDWYYHTFVASRMSYAHGAFVMNISQVISAILVLVFIFRKQIFGKKK